MKLLSPSCLLVVGMLVQVLLEPAVLAACGDLGVPGTCGGDTCLYQPDCTCCTANDWVPDPDDCQLYYVCSSGTATDYLQMPGKCTGDQVFDPTNQVCVDPDSYACPTCTSTPDCVYACASGANGFISSLNDCNQYYECTAGVPGDPIHCPAETPFFDGEDCQTEETSCCRCQPSCDGVNNYVNDPLDCRKYWICSGTPPTLLQGSNWCIDEEPIFDTTIHGCSAEATCVTTCPNVVNTDGCIDPFICPSTGYFAMCPELCVNEYYFCEEVSDKDEYQEPTNCPTNTYFHPDDHLCVNKEDCPYPRP